MSAENVEPFKILSIDGGGLLGLSSAAFIQGIEEHENIRFADNFDLFCGTSTGAIIALALANGRSGEDLVSLYKKLGTSVFPSQWWMKLPRILRSLVCAKYSNANLRSALSKEFGSTTLGDLRSKGKHILVPAFNLTSGSPRLFKTDHSAQLSRDDDCLLVDVAMASTAAPTYLPIVKATHPKDGSVEYFCDGGVAANHPALLGFVEATYEFGINPRRIQILSINTPRKDLSVRRVRILSKGILSWCLKLPAIFTDSNSFLAHTLLDRIVKSYPEPRPRYERIELTNVHGLQMDCSSDSATNTLIQHGISAASCNQTRTRIRPFFKGD